MYKCYTNKTIDKRKVEIFSTFIKNEYNFTVVFNIWLKLINKKNYAYLGGQKNTLAYGTSYRIYFTNGYDNYFMETQFTKIGENEMLEYIVEPIDELLEKRLEFYTEPSIKCLQHFAACFILPVLGIFDVHKEQNLGDVIEDYIKHTYIKPRRHFNFESAEIGNEILTYLNLEKSDYSRPGKLHYKGDEVERTIDFIQFYFQKELCYFVQQAEIVSIGSKKIKIYTHYITKEFEVSKMMLDEYYFNNPESNFQEVKNSSLQEVLDDFYQILKFIDKIRRMGGK